MIEEIWKPVIYNNNYKISNLGRICSLDKEITSKDGKPRKFKGQLVKPITTSKKHLVVNIKVDDKYKIFQVSRLVAIHFIDNPHNYPCVLHKDDVKTNNTIENLYWGNATMNMIDRRNNSEYYGDNHPSSKITESQANEIRRLLEHKELSQRTIARKYGVTQALISSIKNGRVRKFDNLDL